ncbi:syndecan-1-like [Amia ocellicauda]|uniref:syndecan-1-like n=1 Tax=Amia ocellicauda TaxID=2972642 RepID=UPI003464883F
MRMRAAAALLLCLGLWIPAALSNPTPPEDLDGSADDQEFSGSGDSAEFVDTTPPGHDVHSDFVNTTGNVLLVEPKNVPKENKEEEATSFTSTEGSTTHPVVTTPITTSTYAISPISTASPDIAVVPDSSVQETTSAVPDTTTQGAVHHDGAVTSSAPTTTEAPHIATTTTTTTTAASSAFPDLAPKEKDSSITVNQSPFTSKPEDAPSGGEGKVISTPSVYTTQTFSENPIHNEIDSKMFNPAPKDPTESDDSDIILVDSFPTENSNTRALDSAENARSQGFLDNKEVLGGVIAGGIIGLAFAVLLVALMVYRMKKKDEGSYALDEQKHSNGGYQKPTKQEEFLA